MKSFPTSSSLSKPGGTKEKLLKLIRSHPACVLALRLDVTMRISDEDIMEGLANSADNLDIDFRERMVPEEIIQEILNLRREARAEAALMSKIRRHNVWIVLIRLPLCASGILVFISLLLWLTTFEYTRAVCALYEFANATCSQANTCLFRVAVQLPGEEFSIFHPAWKCLRRKRMAQRFLHRMVLSNVATAPDSTPAARPQRLKPLALERPVATFWTRTGPSSATTLVISIGGHTQFRIVPPRPGIAELRPRSSTEKPM